MTLDELRNLQPSDIVNLSLRDKIIGSVILVIIMGIIFWFYFVMPEEGKYNKLQATEKSLKTSLREKQEIAASLPLYKKQIKVIHHQFEHFLKQLPDRAQIPSLLDNISRAGRSNGLNFILFKPEKVVQQKFYAEIPVKIKVVGNYNQMGNFAADIAAMPRIVTLNDIKITPLPAPSGESLAKQARSTQLLELQCTAVTYRYLKTTIIKG